jgi:subtilisin family serine protease
VKIRIDTKPERAGQASDERAIYRVWPDFKVQVLINKTISTVKADAAQKSFAALGRGIVWAVMDSGIDTSHPHFERHGNTRLLPPLGHRDFSLNEEITPEDSEKRACQDPKGHGTHVAGIIAGAATSGNGLMLAAATTYLDEAHAPQRTIESIDGLTAIAPECKLVSMRVLDESGKGNVSSLIAAINYVQEINGYGRRLLIHGVNMSLGYDFDPEWFACGQSPPVRRGKPPRALGRGRGRRRREQRVRVQTRH